MNTKNSGGSAAKTSFGTTRSRSAAVLFLLRAAVLVVAITIWWLIAKYKLLDPTVTSSPEAVGGWLAKSLTGPLLWRNLTATLTATLLAWALASVIGIIAGVALALLPKLEKVINPYISALNAMPRIALAPLFVVAFGLTIQSKIALAFSIVVFLILSAARTGVASVDVELTRLAEVLGANRRQKFFKILLPVAVPSIFGGLRLGIIYGLLGTLTAELIGSVDGIGQQLQQAAGLFQTEAIYGLLIILAVTATAINAFMNLIEKRLLRWQP